MFERLLEKSKGILFKNEFVNDVRSGKKPQTRRVITRINSNVDGHGRANAETWSGLDFDKTFIDPGPSPAGNPGPYLKTFNNYTDATSRIYPNWAKGDYLHVREAVFYEWPTEEPPDDIRDCNIIYRADDPSYLAEFHEYEPETYVWRPSLFMHKWAARTILRIDDIRPERVLDISHEDIMAEGSPIVDEQGAAMWWMSTWDEINQKRGYGTGVNPYTWVLNLSVISKR